MVAGALVFREMGSPLWAAPYGQPTEMYPAEFLAAVSSSTAAEPSGRVEGLRTLAIESLVLPAAELFAGQLAQRLRGHHWHRHWHSHKHYHNKRC